MSNSRLEIRVVVGPLLGCFALLLACPAPTDGGDAGDTGETGEGPGDPEPIDPLDGEGSDPPGDPNPALVWRAPANLGNGLVHDSRYDLQAGQYTETFSGAELGNGVDWAEFVTSHSLKVSRGFRPTNVDAEVTLTPTGSGGSFELGITDRSVYLSDDDANYRTETKTYVFATVADEQTLVAEGPSASGKPRPISIDTFAIAGGPVGATITWVYDDNPVPWDLVISQSFQKFTQTLSSLREKGYRPISLASRYRNGASEYSAIFVADGMPSADWKATYGWDWTDLNSNFDSLWTAGFYPFRGTYEHGSEFSPTFNILWTQRSPQLMLELRYNMDALSFNSEDMGWRQKGYHLENACAYSDAGVTRYAGLWVRNDPYLRFEEGIAVDVGSQAYLSKYKPFHDAAIQTMTQVGTANEGDFFRPSAILYILDGGQPVLNRAYTYAPAIYPDTPLNAPMALASVSKSITAAAVVRELNLRGIPLTAPFAPTAGINNVPTMSTVPTVADVLRNLGGFNATVNSYGDHSLIDASPWGEYPVSGKMMYDYVVSGGKLDINTNDSYWDLGAYMNSQPPSSLFVYSNPGFTMLGELVRVQSGLTYEQYVRVNLLDPLMLGQSIHPDHGHRKDGRVTVTGAPPEPTQAGRGSYLGNNLHPYNSIDCASNSDCSYLICSQTPCPPTPTCTANGTCTGCTASILCRPGWNCVAGECINPQLPLSESERVPPPFNPLDNSPIWDSNAGPVDNTAPATAAVDRYGGRRFLGGAPLAAGGWHGDAASVALLMRAITESGFLMPQAVAAQLWAPQWWNPNQGAGPNWFYGLGWYVRGNWVAWNGGADGSMAVVLHNLAYDFTVVLLTNVMDNGLADFANPLLTSASLSWTQPNGTPQSTLGGPFPCLDDVGTATNECTGQFGAY